MKFLQTLAVFLLWLVAGLCAMWAFGALWFDFPRPALQSTAAIIFAFATCAGIVFLRGNGRKLIAVFLGFALVLGWWLTLQPRNDRVWQSDVAQTAWAEVGDDVITLHNVRNFEYRTESDYTPHWETRAVRLSQLTGLDLAINYWGSPYMAHPIASFQFADAPPVCFSIETRREMGESYSALGGIYRQFELIYVVAEERDVIRVRTNYRQGEDIYFYRTTATPQQARERFLEYVHRLNALHENPRWYNAVTGNCTTSIRTQRSSSDRAPWDWRILVNGYGDELLYERKGIAAAGLPFAELKKSAFINSTAKAADLDPDFSLLIRQGRPGFSKKSTEDPAAENARP